MMDLVQPLAAIFFVAALLGGVLFLLKKRGGVSSSRSRRLEVIERVSLGPHHALHLVRAGDRLVLIATAPSACQLLDHAVSERVAAWGAEA
jgi:flagellar biosynthetic protein FliO